jgi:general secretion pathway protein C
MLVLGCLLTAGTVANLMVAAAPGSPSRETLLPRSFSPAEPELSSADRQGVLDRNPVDTRALQLVPPPVTAEESEKSQLPFRLLGTFAASDPSRSRSMLRHRESQETLVVGVGDVIDGHAVVVQIERERVVFRDNGSIRELRIDREHAPSDPSRLATSEQSGVPIPAATENPRQNPGGRPFDALLADLEGSILQSTSGQARVLPELEGDHMVGLHVSAIEEGSRFAQLGIEEDDVITQFNGVSIDSPFLALHVVREMLEADGYQVTVRRGDDLEHLPGR